MTERSRDDTLRISFKGHWMHQVSECFKTHSLRAMHLSQSSWLFWQHPLYSSQSPLLQWCQSRLTFAQQAVTAQGGFNLFQADWASGFMSRVLRSPHAAETVYSKQRLSQSNMEAHQFKIMPTILGYFQQILHLHLFYFIMHPLSYLISTQWCCGVVLIGQRWNTFWAHTPFTLNLIPRGNLVLWVNQHRHRENIKTVALYCKNRQFNKIFGNILK